MFRRQAVAHRLRVNGPLLAEPELGLPKGVQRRQTLELLLKKLERKPGGSHMLGIRLLNHHLHGSLLRGHVLTASTRLLQRMLSHLLRLARPGELNFGFCHRHGGAVSAESSAPSITQCSQPVRHFLV